MIGGHIGQAIIPSECQWADCWESLAGGTPPGGAGGFRRFLLAHHVNVIVEAPATTSVAEAARCRLAARRPAGPGRRDDGLPSASRSAARAPARRAAPVAGRVPEHRAGRRDLSATLAAATGSRGARRRRRHAGRAPGSRRRAFAARRPSSRPRRRRRTPPRRSRCRDRGSRRRRCARRGGSSGP